MLAIDSDAGSTTPSGDLPDLDELLGIDPDADPEPDSAPPPILDGESPEGLEPLTRAIEGMHASALRLDVDSTGVQTQRLQEDVIYHLDRLLEMAERQQQQQQQQQSSGSNSGEPQPGTEPRSNQQSEPGQSQQPGDSGDVTPTMDGLDPMLGGALDETDSEWGTLPERVRKMLQQGRQDAYSSLYERMTIEYYRRLAREAGNE